MAIHYANIFPETLKMVTRYLRIARVEPVIDGMPDRAHMIAGSPPYQLVHDYAGIYLHPHQLTVMDYLPFLRQSGVGAFRHLRDDPPFREVSLPLKPIESNDVTFANGIPRANGMGGNLTFVLPTEMNVAGIRLRYTCSSSKPYLAIYWKSRNQPKFRDDLHTKYSPTGDRANWDRITWTRLKDDSSTVYAWACQPVQMIRILPMNKATIDIREVTLLVAVTLRKPPDSWGAWISMEENPPVPPVSVVLPCYNQAHFLPDSKVMRLQNALIKGRSPADTAKYLAILIRHVRGRLFFWPWKYNGHTGQTGICYLHDNVYVSFAIGPTLPRGWSVVAP